MAPIKRLLDDYIDHCALPAMLALGNLPHDAWRHFVCIKPVRVDRPL